MVTRSATWGTRLTTQALQAPVLCGALVLAVTWSGALAILLARWGTGALRTAPPLGLGVLAIATLSTSAWLLLWIGRSTALWGQHSAIDLGMRGLALATLLVFGIILSVSETALAPRIAHWTAVVVGGAFVFWDAGSLTQYLRTWTRKDLSPDNGRGASEGIARDVPVTTNGMTLGLETLVGETMLQSLTRTRGTGGEERIEGTLAVEFAAGQRQAAGHVAFCPPLLRFPSLDVEQEDGPPARITIGQKFVYGARFDVKLATPPVAPCLVQLAFVAGADPLGQ